MNDNEDKQRPDPTADSWQQIQDNLKAALDSWAGLSHLAKAPTHQERQLQDIKRLLAEIDLKLKDFDDGGDAENQNTEAREK